MTDKTLLILGAGGLLGRRLLGSERLSGWRVIGHGRGVDVNVDVCADLSVVLEAHAMLNIVMPDAIINLVGLTNVDLCEEFPNESYISNVKSLENVATWIKCIDHPVRLIHISTDQVYDGSGPHLEDNVSLKNYYAFSKYAGELVASSVGATILRTNFFGRSWTLRRSSLTDWLHTSLSNGVSIRVFDDVMFSPLSMGTLVEMISLVLAREFNGIYNVGARDGLSKAEFAYSFARAAGLGVSSMERCSVDDVGFIKTYRPKDMRMNVSRFELATGIFLPSLIDEIEKVAREYRDES